MDGLSDEADSTPGLDELLETYLARHVEARSLAEHVRWRRRTAAKARGQHVRRIAEEELFCSNS
jgi:hypothetical protein